MCGADCEDTQNVANENLTSRSLNCDDPYGVCTDGIIAYTRLVDSKDI